VTLPKPAHHTAQTLKTTKHYQQKDGTQPHTRRIDALKAAH
jgi:hypothetical protein